MSRDRSIHTLSEDEQRVLARADEDLDRLMAIEPSADFAAKVRMRISTEGRAAGWNLRWGLVMATVAFAVIALAVATAAIRRSARGDLAHGSATVPVARDIALPAAGPPATPLRPPTERIAKTHAAPAHGPVVRPKRDALIDRTERASVDRLLALVRKGGIDVPAAEGPSAAPQELALAPVVVKELEVPLLPFGGGSDDPQAVRR